MKQKPVITPSLFFKYAKSPHWIWYDLYGDQSKKGEVSEFTQRLIDEGVLHEENYVKGLEFEEVSEALSQKEKVAETQRLMEEGGALIYQGLIETDVGNALYRGQPDFLERRAGKSKFGDYYYAPVDIKSSAKCEKTEYRMQLTFYSFILEKIQGVFPESGGFINKKHEKLAYEFNEKIKEKTLDRVDTISEIIKGKEPPLKITATSKETPWYEELLKKAEAKKDIALIYGLDGRALVHLRELGIKTVADMAKTDLNSMPKITQASAKTLERAKLQAQSLAENKIIRLSRPAIPESKVKIYFDIEGDPFMNVEYLFGFWINDGKQEPYFKYFLAERPEDEEKMWNEFLEWVDNLPYDEYKVYHYSNYERTQLKKLTEDYGGNGALDEFKKNLIDLIEIVKDSVVMPLYFYSIKDIAKSLDFKWRHEKAGGAQSILWYQKWLETGDRSVLQDIIDYNEDDVRATEFLCEWLESE